MNEFERDIKIKNLDLDIWEIKEHLIQRIHELENRIFLHEVVLRKHDLIPELGDKKIEKDKKETRDFFNKVIKEHEPKREN